MSKITKAQNKVHQIALEILKGDILTDDEKLYVLDNFHEGADFNNSLNGAFFTSREMADALAFEAMPSPHHKYIKSPGNTEKLKVIDLCAGIGSLTHAFVERFDYYNIDYTCVEINAEYVAIGKKIVPNAKWINADVMDLEMLLTLGEFDIAICNPPFGKIASMRRAGPNYMGKYAEFKVLDIASVVAKYFCALLPRASVNFQYDKNGFKKVDCAKFDEFQLVSGFELMSTVGQDINNDSIAGFKSTKIGVELVTADTSQIGHKIPFGQTMLF